jgi:hypothetical protein
MQAGIVCAIGLMLAGCNTRRETELVAARPHGATVAFESIDGLPPSHFRTLVADLNDEAQARRLAVISRHEHPAYRVRGYFAAAVENGRTSISWVWDVFDRNDNRAYRISGTEPGGAGTAWNAADASTLQKIATSSMDQLGAFLRSPKAVPGAPPQADEPRLALLGQRDLSPEAAGIFKVVPPAPVAPSGGNEIAPSVPQQSPADVDATARRSASLR